MLYYTCMVAGDAFTIGNGVRRPTYNVVRGAEYGAAPEAHRNSVVSDSRAGLRDTCGAPDGFVWSIDSVLLSVNS